MAYNNSKTVDCSFDDIFPKLTEELSKEGFGVVTEVNMQETLKKKLNVDFRKYKIIGVCNPGFAYKAISAEENIGVLLPCNFVLQEKEEGKVQVSVINPMISMQSVKNNALDPIASEVSEKLKRVLEAL